MCLDLTTKSQCPKCWARVAEDLHAGFCNAFQSDRDLVWGVWGPCFVLWSATGGHPKKTTKSFQRWKCCSLTITSWRQESSGESKTSRGLFWHKELSLYCSQKKKKKVILFVVLFRRLKSLNLQGNCISEIPYLQLRGSFKPSIEEFEYGKFWSLFEFKIFNLKWTF